MSVVMLTALTPCMRGPYIVEQGHDVATGSHNKITGMKQNGLVRALGRSVTLRTLTYSEVRKPDMVSAYSDIAARATYRIP